MSPAQIVAVGTNIASLTSDLIVLRNIGEAYSIAVQNTLILVLTTVYLTVPFAAFMEQKNVKKEVTERHETATAGPTTAAGNTVNAEEK